MKLRLIGLVAATALEVGLVGAAMAADMPLELPRMAPIPVYNWSGWYVGGNAGAGWGNFNRSIAFSDPTGIIGFGTYFAAGGNAFPNLSPSGFIGGGQIGADWQWGNFVGGAVADFQGADISALASATVQPPGGFVQSTQTLSQKLDFLGTARARGGWAFGNWLLYGTGGFAYGHATSSLTFNAPAAAVFLSNSAGQSPNGWVAGAGVNYGWWNWVAGVEWLHYDLGNTTVTATLSPLGVVPGSLTATQRLAGDVLRGTLSYKFNWY
jgi:outer membrane immunogenic protein